MITLRYPELESFLFAHADVQKVLDLLEPVSADGGGEQAADSQAASGNETGALAQAMTGHRKPAAAILLKAKGKDIKYALRGSSFSAPYYSYSSAPH